MAPSFYQGQERARDPGQTVIRVFTDTKHDAVCRKCGGNVQWAQVARTKKWILFNRPLLPHGRTLDRDSDRPCEYWSHEDVHWNNCSAD